MAELDGLIDMIPIGDIAKKLGINEKEAKSAVKAALPTICLLYTSPSPRD